MQKKRASQLDLDRIDATVLALLLLGLHGEDGRVWKTFDWETPDRLHAKGMISNPRSKSKSVVLSETGQREAQRHFDALFKHAQSD